MAKRIIQMYDKYKSTTKVYPKVIKECLQEDVKSYIEGQVVANPTLAGTENALTGIQVGSTKYKVEQPINVVANPTLAGTESDLTGLEVGNTKYKIGGGKQLYKHIIMINSNTLGTQNLLIEIINDSATQFTITTLATYIRSKFNYSTHDHTNGLYPAFGWITNTNNEKIFVTGLYSKTEIDGSIYAYGFKPDFTNKQSQFAFNDSTMTFIDTVITL